MRYRLIISFSAFVYFCTAAPTVSAAAAPAASSSSSTAISSAAVPAAAADSSLLAPEKATEKAPPLFRVKFSTTKGDMVVEVRRVWAPMGADRFYNLVKIGFYDDAAFFRVGHGFMAQTGIPGDPAVAAKWNEARIPDDPPAVSNNRGTVCFVMGGPNTRTTQIFFSSGDNWMLDLQGFAPFGLIVEGGPVVDQIYSDYGIAGPPKAPDMMRLQREGNAYLKANFPNLDYIKAARIIQSP